MKTKKIILFLLILNLFLQILFVNSQSSNIFNPKYLMKESNEDKKNYPVILGAKEYGIGLVHGILCSIPTQVSQVFKVFKNSFITKFGLAGFADAGFSIALSMFGITNEPNYATKEFLEERISQLFENMKTYIENRIDAEKIENSKIQYLKLRSPIQNFKDLQVIMEYERNTTGTISQDTKYSIIGTYWVLLAALEEATIEFGHDSHIYQTSLLYLESSILYGIALKDGINDGFKMGLPKQLINETTVENVALSKKFNELCKNVFLKWPKMINTVITSQKEQEKLNKKIKKKDSTSVERTKFKIPSKGELLSSFYYANTTLYPAPIYFINDRNIETGQHESKDTIKIRKFCILNLDAPIGSIYVVDPLIMVLGWKRVETPIFKDDPYEYGKDKFNDKPYPNYDRYSLPFKRIEQKNDFLTGLNGYLNNNTEYFNSYSIKLNFVTLNVKNNIGFRFICTDSTEYSDFNFGGLPTFTFKVYSSNGTVLSTNQIVYPRIILTKKYRYVSGRYMGEIGPYNLSYLSEDSIVLEIKPYMNFGGTFTFISFEIISF